MESEHNLQPSRTDWVLPGAIQEHGSAPLPRAFGWRALLSVETAAHDLEARHRQAEVPFPGGWSARTILKATD
jgi:hypothetical protein